MKKIILTAMIGLMCVQINAQELARNNKEDIEIPKDLKRSFEYLGNVCYDKSSDQKAFKNNSYYTTMLFQAYLANTRNFNMK